MGNADERSYFFSLALARLSRKESSKSELLDYLKRKSAPDSLATSVVSELEEEGSVNDLRYAKIFTRHYQSRGKGPRFIMQKLREKGVTASLPQIQLWYEETGSEGDTPESAELAYARQLVERKYAGFAEDRAVRSKAFGALLRRGFSADTARKVLEPKAVR